MGRATGLSRRRVIVMAADRVCTYVMHWAAGPGSPQARYKEMMTQKYANVSSDPNGYPHTRHDQRHDTTND